VADTGVTFMPANTEAAAAAATSISPSSINWNSSVANDSSATRAGSSAGLDVSPIKATFISAGAAEPKGPSANLAGSSAKRVGSSSDVTSIFTGASTVSVSDPEFTGSEPGETMASTALPSSTSSITVERFFK